MLQMKGFRNQLTHADFADGTFTITNLGNFGVRNFIPVINGRQSAILGVSSERNVCIPDGQSVRQTKVMSLELTYDHRIINGIIGANFLNKIAKNIESFANNSASPSVPAK
jgi:pyruvate/2-oxoglutarate dehydrogenase complex dihydrolipoamide acyltransferase (E2) component